MYRHNSKRRRFRPRHYVREQPVWPLPAVMGHPPVIATVDPATHEAVLAYGWSMLDGASDGASRSGARAAQCFYMPQTAPVLAMKSGVVLAVTARDGIHRVTIAHGNGFNTDYEGLHEAIACPAGSRRVVKAGEVIGTIRSPDLAQPLRFTLSRTDLIPGLSGFPRAVDPLDVLLGSVSIPLAEAPGRRKEAA